MSNDGTAESGADEVLRLLPFGLGDRIVREVQLARFIGKMAVDHGLSQLQDRLAASGESVDTEVTASDGSSEAPLNGGPELVVVPSVDSLAISDYDQLPAAHIVPLLADLEGGDRRGLRRGLRLQQPRERLKLFLTSYALFLTVNQFNLVRER